MKFKKCSKCHEELNFKHFSKQSKSRDGLQPWCKACIRAYRIEVRGNNEPAQSGEKRCTKCGITKSVQNFWVDRVTKDGRWSSCVTCGRNDIEERKNRTGFDSQHNFTCRKYNLDPDVYKWLLNQQDGLCAACGGPETLRRQNGQPRRLSIDHDHSSGHHRGLLCHSCNVTLGYAKEDINRLLGIVAYILRWQTIDEYAASFDSF